MKAQSFFAAVLAFVLGCSDPRTDAKFAQTVPGIYEGSAPGFSERVELREDGTFQHAVFVQSRKAVGESGKWTYDTKSGMVRVEPFTSFWDIHKRVIITNGVINSADALFVMRYGERAETISPSIDFEYRLLKRNADAVP
jgi:hypothetical protein